MSEEKTKTIKKYYDHVSVGNRTKQLAYFVLQHDKNRIFEELLKTYENKQMLVLVKSKKNADELMKHLKHQEIESLAIHGNHRASQIEDAEQNFNAKKINILITTNRILEAMNLQGVELHLAYDLPLDAHDYFKGLILVDEVGESIALIDPADEDYLASIEQMMRCEMLESEIKDFKHTPSTNKTKKDKTKKPRHKKVQQEAKRKAEMKAKWIPRSLSD